MTIQEYTPRHIPPFISIYKGGQINITIRAKRLMGLKDGDKAKFGNDGTNWYLWIDENGSTIKGNDTQRAYISGIGRAFLKFYNIDVGRMRLRVVKHEEPYWKLIPMTD